MKCIKCGTENKENSTFCKSCGARLDGKIVCKKCKQLIEDDDAFCIHCGAKLKKIKIDEPKKEVSLKTKSIYKSLGFYLGLATVLLCLIFTFFIGVKNVTNERYEGSSDTFVCILSIFSGEYSILDFFNYSFLEIYLKEDQIYYLIAELTVTLIVVVFLVLTALSFIFSLLTFIKSIRDEKYLNKFIKWSLVSYLIYIFFVVCVQQLFAYTNNSSTVIGQMSVYYRYEHYRLNNETIVGIVLTSVAMLSTLFFYGLYKFKGFNKQYVSNAISTLLFMTIGFVGLGLISGAIVNTYTYNVVSSEGIYFFLYGLTSYETSGEVFTTFLGYYIPTLICVFLIIALTLAFMIIFALLLKDWLVDFGTRKAKRYNVSGLCLGAFLIVISILEMVLLHFNTSYYYVSYTARYGLPIGIMILGVIFILYTIISSALLKAKSNGEVEQVQSTKE